MGIQGLTKLIGDNAPSGVKENDIKNYFGRKVCAYGVVLRFQSIKMELCMHFFNLCSYLCVPVSDFDITAPMRPNACFSVPGGDRCIYEHLPIPNRCAFRRQPAPK